MKKIKKNILLSMLFFLTINTVKDIKKMEKVNHDYPEIVFENIDKIKLVVSPEECEGTPRVTASPKKIINQENPKMASPQKKSSFFSKIFSKKFTEKDCEKNKSILEVWDNTKIYLMTAEEHEVAIKEIKKLSLPKKIGSNKDYLGYHKIIYTEKDSTIKKDRNAVLIDLLYKEKEKKNLHLIDQLDSLINVLRGNFTSLTYQQKMQLYDSLQGEIYTFSKEKFQENCKKNSINYDYFNFLLFQNLIKKYDTILKQINPSEAKDITVEKVKQAILLLKFGKSNAKEEDFVSEEKLVKMHFENKLRISFQKNDKEFPKNFGINIGDLPSDGKVVIKSNQLQVSKNVDFDKNFGFQQIENKEDLLDGEKIQVDPADLTKNRHGKPRANSMDLELEKKSGEDNEVDSMSQSSQKIKISPLGDVSENVREEPGVKEKMRFLFLRKNWMKIIGYGSLVGGIGYFSKKYFNESFFRRLVIM